MPLDTIPTTFSVGSPHPFWPLLPHRDGMVALYNEAGIDLILMLDPCTSTDVRSLQKDGLKFGLCRLGGGYCWLLWTGIAVFDAPYLPTIEAPERQGLPWRPTDRSPEGRAAISLHVIDGGGITRALKLVTVSPRFTSRLELLHAEALARGVRTRAEWDQEVAKFYLRYPTPNAAFKQALVTSWGGE